MGAIIGDVLTGVLVLIHIVSHKRQGDFRGFWLQIAGAFCIGWEVNLLFNIRSAPMNPIGAIVIVGLLAGLFYVLAKVRRK